MSDSTPDLAAVFAELQGHPELIALVHSGLNQGTAELALQTQLRREWPARLVAAAMLLAELRQRAGNRFSRSESMWFSRSLLEQATSEQVAVYKAGRFAGQPGPVWDLCCGAGSDAIALAGQHEVIAVDRSPLACFCTRANAAAYGLAERISTRCEDVTTLAGEGELVHIDPDRRPGGRRTLRIEQFEPGLDFLERLPELYAGGAIKLSPASNFPGRFPGAEIELISVNGECREATVWFGSLGQADMFRATVLPAGETLCGDPLDSQAPLAPLDGWLFDPDPAIVRAGLVDLLAEHCGLSRLDDAEEYLTGPQSVDSPFLTGLEIVCDLPHSDKAVRRWFREHPARDVEIRCRHLPIDAARIRRRLPTGEGEPLVLVYARLQGAARAVVCRRPRV